MNSDNELDDLDLEKLPGILDNDYQNNKSNEVEFLNEDAYFPKLTEEPYHSNQIKNIIQEINAKKIIPKEEENFTFKVKSNNNNNKNKEEKINRYDYKNKSELNNNINTNNKNKLGSNKKKLKANIINFDELMAKKNKDKEIVNKETTNKSKNKNSKKKNIKIDFTRKLYQNKKNYETNKELKIDKIITEANIKNKKMIKNLSKNKSEKSFGIKKAEIKRYNKDKSLNNNENIKNKNINTKIINYFKLDNSPVKKKGIIMKYKNKNLLFNLENQKENTNKSYIIESNSRDTSLLLNKSSRTIKSKNPKTLRKFDKINIMNEMESKINLALNKNNNNKNRRYSNINDEKINFDKSKFEKYDIEQMRYGLIKDYSFVHPEKDENFLERMQFDFFKRKNKEMKINEFVEKNKNKYKLNEAERKKAFNRLMEDANRRIIMKQEIIENEKYLTDYRDILENEKKYNPEEWDKIYKKRFKEYEDIKKRKIDIQRQNEKIKKMLKEEEEINMCQIKKIPQYKVKENTERLYNDAIKRQYLRNNRNLISDKSARNFKQNKSNICLTNFNDEEDASKYMKNYKAIKYNFYGDKRNNDNFNVSFDKKLKKSNKITVTEFNNLRFDNNSGIIKYPKKEINKRVPLNYNLNFKNNIIQPYFNFKKNIKKINNKYNTTPTMPCEYNYNNYNIYNINNLNNNINNMNYNINNNNINNSYNNANNNNNYNNNNLNHNNINNNKDNYINYNNSNNRPPESNIINTINNNNISNVQNNKIHNNNQKKIIIIFENKDGIPTVVKCKTNDKFNTVVNQYRSLSKDTSSSTFIYNNKQISNYETIIEQLEIKDNSYIKALD